MFTLFLHSSPSTSHLFPKTFSPLDVCFSVNNTVILYVYSMNTCISLSLSTVAAVHMRLGLCTWDQCCVHETRAVYIISGLCT